MKNLNVRACHSVIVKAARIISDLEEERKVIWGTKDGRRSEYKFIKSQSIKEEQQVWATVIKDLQIFIEKEQEQNKKKFEEFKNCLGV